MIRIDNNKVIRDILSENGVISQKYLGFESRPQQVEMACAVHDVLLEGGRLAVEAGTGVGKSFAYLVPAMEIIAKKGGKLLVSTFTITLQEQLVQKDIPFLSGHLPYSFTAVLAKGRSNYLCKRRLEFARRRGGDLFGKFSDEIDNLARWAQKSSDGSLSDLESLPHFESWDAVASEHGNCRGKICSHFQDCFYQKARRRLDSADIIVANHAMMFNDLLIKEEGARLLPEYDYVIIDEAHNIERVAEDHFGIDFSSYKVKRILDSLYNQKGKKGILNFRRADKAIDLVLASGKAAKNFFKGVGGWYKENRKETGGKCGQNFVDDCLSSGLKDLRTELARLANDTEDIDEKFELMRMVNRAGTMASELDEFMRHEKNDYVYWIEMNEGRKESVTLKSAPLNVGPDVKKVLFDCYDSVVMTSATLSCGSEGDAKGFDFFAGRIGLEDFKAVKLGSPFDYEKQVTIYVEADLPEPNQSDFTEKAVEALKKYIMMSRGRAFVLFTSYSMMENMGEMMVDWLKENDLELLQQGTGLDRGSMLRFFKKNSRSVLFGTDSFWQGVDVPGDALSNVMIVRLPFAVPDQPLIAGRLEQIRKNGGNPFFDYQLPSAIIKFKQGFGRLIRTKTDSGIVVILDSRIVTKQYGQWFLAAVPKCKIEIVSSH